jgi:hypothetical protein
MDLLEWSSRYLRLTLGYLGVAPSQQQLHRLSVYLYWGFLPSIKSLGGFHRHGIKIQDAMCARSKFANPRSNQVSSFRPSTPAKIRTNAL